MTGDYNKALEAAKDIRERYPKYEIQDTPALVLEYYWELISFHDTGGITRKQASFLIADTMWYNCVRTNYVLESIAIEAGCLELPDRQVQGDPDARWEFLRIWIYEELLHYRRAD
jgi:hypothetical protein